MGKKSKVGKSRKDKFYHLAKETGYRARSAFKLIQLNKKFGFLQDSRVVVDLCAAPGGWLQVASNFMPVSSVIIGIDLVTIKPIRNVVTIQADITTDHCRQMLKKELKTWSADVFLNDGAPNVGSAWVQDAFSQAQLTLAAFKLAHDHLRKGGWFITKVFRSKDYSPLLWVFKQLFNKVHATKPQASRNESAEIFVVCQGYLKPDKLDPKFLDPKFVFKEIEESSNVALNILKPEKVKRQRQGYEENNITLHSTMTAKDFIVSNNPIEALSTTNKISIDDENIFVHKYTTDEIKMCCEDIKVLGRRELKMLLTWRKHLRKNQESDKSQEIVVQEEKGQDEENLSEFIEKVKEEEEKLLKRKRKHAREQKKKIRERIASKLSETTGESLTNEEDLFTLKQVDKKEDFADGDGDSFEETNSESESEDITESEAENEYAFGDDNLYEKPIKRKRLNEEIEPIKTKRKFVEDVKTAKQWYEKEAFKDFEEGDEDWQTMSEIKQTGFEDHTEVEAEEKKERSKRRVNEKDVSVEQDKPIKNGFLTPEALSIGTALVTSKKRRRDVIDHAFNRYSFTDENLPSWFAEEERKHTVRQIPVTKEEVEYYKYRMREINARPIKKVIEAKAKKKSQMLKKLDRARRKAQGILDATDVDSKEKQYQIKGIYKRAGLLHKKKAATTYVVAKRGLAGKKYKRPVGVKGQYKVVDPRMKKDIKKQKMKNVGRK